MGEHTPTPWEVVAGDDYLIVADAYPEEFIGRFKSDDLGPYVACVGNRPADFGEANAALIVNAVNSHRDLIAAIETAIKVAAEARDEWDRAPNGMKAGKLLIALSDPKLKYRADITEMHETLARVRALEVSDSPAEPAKAGAA